MRRLFVYDDDGTDLLKRKVSGSQTRCSGMIRVPPSPDHPPPLVMTMYSLIEEEGVWQPDALLGDAQRADVVVLGRFPQQVLVVPRLVDEDVRRQHLAPLVLTSQEQHTRTYV